jgi:hypothetical protein
VRYGEPGDDQWLIKTVGDALAAPFSQHLDASVRIALLPPTP